MGWQLALDKVIATLALAGLLFSGPSC